MPVTHTGFFEFYARYFCSFFWHYYNSALVFFVVFEDFLFFLLLKYLFATLYPNEYKLVQDRVIILVVTLKIT